MSDKPLLSEYQDALVEVLSSGLRQEEVMEKLKTDVRFEKFQDYVKEFDPDMVAVACELMGKWAKRLDDEKSTRDKS